MTPSDLSAVAAELATIKLILYVIGVVVVVSVILTCLRTYVFVKQFVRSRLGDLFRENAQRMLEKGELDELVQLARSQVVERPNDANGHWYLARALHLQGRFEDAMKAYEETRRLAPTWSADHIDPWIVQIKAGSPK